MFVIDDLIPKIVFVILVFVLLFLWLRADHRYRKCQTKSNYMPGENDSASRPIIGGYRDLINTYDGNFRH